MQTITAFPALARVGIKKIWSLFSLEQPNQWKTMVTVIDTKQQYERFQQIADFGYAQTIAEGDPVPYDNLLPGYSKDHYPLMRVIGYNLSYQAKETDIYGKLANPARQMAQSLYETKELHVANLFNNGFSASYLGPDSKALFAIDHPLDSGTSSNRPNSGGSALDIELSITALEQGKQELTRQKSHRGKPMPRNGKTNLYVPPEKEMLAARLCAATMLPQTADNDPNIAGRSTTPYVNVNFTSTTAWFLRSTGFQNPLFLLTRQKQDVKVYDVGYDNLSWKFVGFEEYLAGWEDWRGLWGTNP